MALLDSIVEAIRTVEIPGLRLLPKTGRTAGRKNSKDHRTSKTVETDPDIALKADREERIPLRFGDNMRAKVVFEPISGEQTSTTPVEMTVLDFSSTGFGLAVDAEHLPPGEQYGPGTRAAVDLTVPGIQTDYQFDCVVCGRTAYIDDQAVPKVRYGLFVLNSVIELADFYANERKMLNLDSKDVGLLALVEHPLAYNQESIVAVREISCERFIVRNRNKALVLLQGMEISLSLNLFGQNKKMQATVQWIRKDRGFADICLHLSRLDRRTEKGIANFILARSDIGPSELRRVGFDVSQVKSVFTYGFKQTEAEYQEVLKLRHRSYSAVKKIAKDSPLDAVSYYYDSFSRILTARHHGLLIGSVNVLFADGKDKQFEVQKILPPEDFAKLPPPQEMVEVASLCVHHEYRKTNVLLGIFERLFQVILISGKSYTLAGTDKHLWKIYKSIGFKKTGIKYKIAKYGDLEHDVILMHKSVGLYGSGMPLKDWGRTYYDIANYMDKRDLTSLSPEQKAKLLARKFVVSSFLKKGDD